MRPEKQLMENEYKSRLDRSRAVVLTEFTNLSASTLNRLRKELKNLEAEYLVVKNRIFKRALKDTGFSSLAPLLQGQSALAFGGDKLPELARFLIGFEKEEGSPRIRAAIWGNDYFDAAAVRRLAGLPPRPVLLSQLLGGIQAPLAGLAGVLKQLLTALVIALKEISVK